MSETPKRLSPETLQNIRDAANVVADKKTPALMGFNQAAWIGERGQYIIGEIDALNAELSTARAVIGEAVFALNELHSLIKGECPSLLEDDFRDELALTALAKLRSALPGAGEADKPSSEPVRECGTCGNYEPGADKGAAGEAVVCRICQRSDGALLNWTPKGPVWECGGEKEKGRQG